MKECGFASVELCGVHFALADEATWDGVIDRYAAAGLKIVSIGVQGIKADRAVMERNFRFAQRCGAKFMSVDIHDELEAWAPLAEKFAEQYDIRMGLHNHGRGHPWGSARVIEKLFARTGPRLGLCLDTAWAMDAGDDPIAMVERFGARLYGLHVKDFVFDRAGRPEDVVPGTGNLDLRRLRAAVKKVNFQGYAVLEYEGDVDDPVPAVKKCVTAMAAAFTD
jgi:sugar phosphate isomerase/epimerase